VKPPFHKTKSKPKVCIDEQDPELEELGFHRFSSADEVFQMDQTGVDII
jgi:hypothetical protein